MLFYAPSPDVSDLSCVNGAVASPPAHLTRCCLSARFSRARTQPSGHSPPVSNDCAMPRGLTPFCVHHWLGHCLLDSLETLAPLSLQGEEPLSGLPEELQLPCQRENSQAKLVASSPHRAWSPPNWTPGYSGRVSGISFWFSSPVVL